MTKVQKQHRLQLSGMAAIEIKRTLYMVRSSLLLRRTSFCQEVCDIFCVWSLLKIIYSVNKYMFKVKNNKWCHSAVLMFDFEHVFPWVLGLFQAHLKLGKRQKYLMFDWVSEVQSLKWFFFMLANNPRCIYIHMCILITTFRSKVISYITLKCLDDKASGLILQALLLVIWPLVVAW